MAKDNTTKWILGVAVVALVYFLVAGSPWATEPTAPTPSDGALCSIEDIAFSPQMVRLGKAGTSLSTSAHNYFVITDNLGSFSAAVDATVPTEYAMQIMFGENGTAYYTVVENVNTGCKDPKYHSVALALADTSLNSFYAKNSDGSVNGASNDEPMGADDTFETTVTIKAGSDTYFGNPTSSCENIAVVEFDKTYIRQVSGDDPAPVPGFFTYSNTSAYDGSAAFVIPKSADGAEVSFNVVIESTGVQPDGTNDPIVYLYDCDIDKNEDTLELIHSVEDEDLTSISLAGQSSIIHLS